MNVPRRRVPRGGRDMNMGCGISTGIQAFPQFPPFRRPNTIVNENKGFSSSSYAKNVSSTYTKTPMNIANSGRETVGRSLITPGSAATNVSIAETKILVAITEGRGAAKCEVGIAAIDLRRPNLILCQFSDTHSYIHTLTKLNYFNPVEIILPHTFNCGSVTTELYRLIRDQFPNICLVSIQRKFFSDSFGFQYIKELCAPEYANIQLLLVHKFYALTTASAILKYLEQVQCVHFAPRSLKIEYHCSQNSAIIDVETSIRLELVEPLVSSSDRHSSLLSILNYTYTAGGLRNLRANILQPPCDENLINCRLDCIDELLQNNEGFLPELKKVMRQFLDVDKILWLCMLLPVQDGNKAGENQLNQTLQLKATLDNLPNLIQSLQMSKGRWFHGVKKELEDPKFVEIKNHIKKVIQDDVHAARGPGAHFQRCFAVRPNINGLLDVARKSYSELISDIQEKVNELSEKYGLPLRLNCNATRGFHIVLSVGSKNRNKFNVEDLPPVFFEVNKHGSTITMTTEEIVLLDHQAKETLKEIQTMSNVIICDLLSELRSYMHVLYKLCENIAELDLILSLALASSSGNYVRPIFGTYLELKDSLHPILECLLPSSPIPNDVFSSPEFNFHVVTGPNMGGKSIYIKQIALLQIMAQIGCFVPATKAVFRIADNIFSRIGFNDSIECNASTYLLEMKEMQYIMKTVTPSSLIIIDEFCRGTSSEEGTSMAWAICEYLLNKEAFTFFTTHFIYLTKLEEVYHNVCNLYTQATKSGHNDGLVYKYKIMPGITDIHNYGLTLAKNTNMPKSVLALAEDLITIITKQKKPIDISTNNDTGDALLYKLASDIIQLSRKLNTNLTDYNTTIDKFKNAHPSVMEKILREKRNENSSEINSAITSRSESKSTVSLLSSDCDNSKGEIKAPTGSKGGSTTIAPIVSDKTAEKTRGMEVHVIEAIPRNKRRKVNEDGGDSSSFSKIKPENGNSLGSLVNQFNVISFAKRSDAEGAASDCRERMRNNVKGLGSSSSSIISITSTGYRHDDKIAYDEIFCEPDVMTYLDAESPEFNDGVNFAF